VTLRITRPCGRCEYEAECTPFLGALRVLVADHDQRAQHPLPDVCVECLLFLPKRRPDAAQLLVAEVSSRA